jgi:CubicO group peptidase (beta-lactamase class C family)
MLLKLLGMTKLFLWIVISLAFIPPSCNRNPESPPVQKGDFSGIDSLFSKYIEDGEIAGASALIANNGEFLYYNSSGYSNLEEQIPLKKDDIFFIASQTKAITSVAVMMLWEEGKFDLDDALSKFLPEFAHPHLVAEFDPADSSYTPIASSRVPTIRQLLTHTSGYPYPNNPDKALGAIYAKNGIFGGIRDRNTSLEEEMQKIAAMPLLHEPGDAFTYGLSTDILGYLVETVSGMSLEEFFLKRIFNPLGMKDTHFRLPDEKLERLMTLYSEDPTTGKLISKPMDPSLFKAEKYLFSGGGGLLSTAMDYHIFQQMILDGGIYKGTRLLRVETVGLMTRNQIGTLGAGSIFLTNNQVDVLPSVNERDSIGFFHRPSPSARRLICSLLHSHQHAPCFHRPNIRKQPVIYDSLSMCNHNTSTFEMCSGNLLQQGFLLSSQACNPTAV